MNRLIPLILAVALFMENMDSTVIATALPAIAADIGVSAVALKLALTSYLVALAIFIPLSGWMADRFGAKRIFRVAIAVFMIGSLWCAVSGSLVEFVAARFLQGLGGAMMVPVARLVLVRTTERADLVSAMALLSIPALVGPLSGPPLGGFITTYFSWHWIFLINIPTGIVGIILSTIFLPEIESATPPPIDVLGFTLSGLATSGLVFGLSVVSLPALPPMVGIVVTLIGLSMGMIYVRHARRHPAPVLNLLLFDKQTFRTAVLGGALFRVAAGALPFLLPLMLQLGFGLTPFQSGSITFVGAIGAFCTKFVASRVFRLGGFRTVLLTSLAAGSLFTAINGLFVPATPYLLIIAALIIGGFARSFFFTGINALTFADIETGETSQATAIASAVQQISRALGIAIGGTLLEVSSTLKGAPLDVSDSHIAFFA
ncbi:MAG TPA: MFS transporter, partial [Pararhizobium sp.]|nr:MFS transporter [Pararhizobium sp.]